MERKKFENNFRTAISKAINDGQEYIKEILPTNFVVDLFETDSKDTHQVKELGRYNNLEVVIDKIYKNGSVPRWVDLNIESIEKDKTVIQCDYSNIFFKDEKNLLHQTKGVIPFHVLSPNIPSSHWDFEKNEMKEGKFSIKDLKK